jgi:pyridoxal phosphate enzyme (YggS family)
MTVLPVNIADRIDSVRRTLPTGVRLIAVSKKMPSEAIRLAYGAGLRDFGESQVQEAIAKQAQLGDLTDITWHLIGHLQGNKARKAVNHFQWIHSVDSLKLAERLERYAAEAQCQPRCCLQVKLRDDPSKTGFDVADLWSVLPQLNALHHLTICGLMVIPPFGLPAADNQGIFEQARALADQINGHGFEGIQIKELSMGMSGDYATAISAGATMVRLGTILFGKRESISPADRA